MQVELTRDELTLLRRSVSRYKAREEAAVAKAIRQGDHTHRDQHHAEAASLARLLRRIERVIYESSESHV